MHLQLVVTKLSLSLVEYVLEATLSVSHFSFPVFGQIELNSKSR